MSHDALPFLETIRAAMARDDQDAGPWLVYADWLEERGECELAELIRTACELETLGPDPHAARRDAAMQRVGELERVVAKAMPHLGGSPPALTWRRGLVIELSAAWRAWLAHGDKIASRHPVVAVQLCDATGWDEIDVPISWDKTGTVARLARWPGIGFSIHSRHYRHAAANDFRHITGDRLYEAMREQPVRPGDTLDWLPMWREQDRPIEWRPPFDAGPS